MDNRKKFHEAYNSAKTGGDLDNAIKILDLLDMALLYDSLLVTQGFCGVTMRDELLMIILRAKLSR